MAYYLKSTSLNEPVRKFETAQEVKVALVDAFIEISGGKIITIERFRDTSQAGDIHGNWHVFVKYRRMHLVVIEEMP